MLAVSRSFGDVFFKKSYYLRKPNQYGLASSVEEIDMDHDVLIVKPDVQIYDLEDGILHCCSCYV